MKTAKEISAEISAKPARTAWQKAVKNYAKMTLEEFAESVGEGEPVTLAGIMRGARDWQFYSRGGMSLCYNKDIARAILPTSELKRNQYGENPPNKRLLKRCEYIKFGDWIDVQAQALKEAGEMIIAIANA